MSDELALIPRDELQRALAKTTTNLQLGSGLMITGSAAVAAGSLLYAPIENIGITATLISGGLVVAVHGYLKLIRAMRMKSWLEDKLRGQQLPSSYLLRG
jgi:hypothetical protein